MAQVSLMVVFLMIGTTISLTSSEGPDEVAHYYFNRFVAKYGRLPLNMEERLEAGYKADLPPLFYLITGTLGRGLDLESPPYLKVTRDNPRLQLVTGHGNIKAWRMIKTVDPIQGEVLLWYLGRWVALLCGVATLVLTYFLILKTEPGYPWLAVSAVALLAFLPTYNYISGITSYESLIGMLMSLYFLLLFYIINTPTRNWLYFGIGLSVGLAAAARQTPWVVIPVVPVVVLWLAYRQQWPWRVAGWRLVLFGLGLLLTFGAWVLYIAIYFNQVAELGWFQGLLSPVLVGDGSGKTSLQIASMMTNGELGFNEFSRQKDTFWQWVWHFFSGVWGRGWLGWLLLGVWGLALVGLIRRWRRDSEETHLWIVLLIVHIGLLLFFPLLRFIFSGQASTAMSQHILFPAAAAIIVLLVHGLRAWFIPKVTAGLLFGLSAIYLWQSLVAIPGRYDEPLPVRALPLSANEQVVATFNSISLIDREYLADDQVLKVTLLWRAETLSDEDYQIELILLDHVGQPQARWVGQPLNGRYPTRAWQPGDRIRDEIYLPIVGLADGDYHLQLRVLGETGVIPAAEGEEISLGQVTLTTPALPVATDTLLLGEREIGFTFWQQDDSATEVPLFGENATVIFSTQARYGDEVQLKLVGPDGQPQEPVDHTGYVYNFNIAPHFVSGDYRLRVEQWAEGNLVAEAETPVLLRVKTEARQFEAGPIARPLSANFAGYVALLGYDLPKAHVQPGDTLPITFYWQARRTIGADLVMFNRLVDEEQKVWAGRDRIAREVYSTMFWAPGEIVTDPVELQIGAGTPAGIYNLLVGLYLPVGEAAVSLPLAQEGQLTDITNVSLGPIKVGKTPPGYTIEQANPQIRVNQPFGETPNLTLLGYDIVDQTAGSESGMKLTLYWQVESPLNIDYTTFVHLRQANGLIMAQHDRLPLEGRYPTSLWDGGEIIADTINLSIPEDLPAGRYELVVGMYDVTTGDRLLVPDSVDNSVPLREVQVW